MSTINERVLAFIKAEGLKPADRTNYWDFWLGFRDKYKEDSPKSGLYTVSGIVFKVENQNQHCAYLFAKFEGESNDSFVQLGGIC